MLWIIGKSFSELATYLHQHKVEFGVLADSKLNPKNIYATEVVEVDFSSKQTVLDSVSKLENVTAILVAGYEQYVLPAAWLSDHFHVPGPDEAAALRATDKYLMRQALLRDSPELTPAFIKVTSEADLRVFTGVHGFPVALKPTNLMKSLFVTKCDTLKELQARYRELSKILPTLSIGQHKTEILLEEFMEGSMYTVAGFADATGNIVTSDKIADCIMAREVGYDDNFVAERRLPSQVTPEVGQQILQAAATAARTLDLRSSALHIEIMLTATGPKIIEIGARIGGYRARMYAYACGIDLYGALLDVATGKPVIIDSPVERACAVVELFPDVSGNLRTIKNLLAISKLPTLLSFKQKFQAGDRVGRAVDGHRAVAIVILGSESGEALEQDLVQLRRRVNVIVD